MVIAMTKHRHFKNARIWIAALPSKLLCKNGVRYSRIGLLIAAVEDHDATVVFLFKISLKMTAEALNRFGIYGSAVYRLDDAFHVNSADDFKSKTLGDLKNLIEKRKRLASFVSAC